MNIEIQSQINLDDLAATVAGLREKTALHFLERLDNEMASWDFTQKAADLFVRAAAELNVGSDGHNPTDQALLARVTEFARQSDLNPSISNGDVIMGTWTDPAAEPCQLKLSDLKALIELATVGYVSMIEARSNPR